MEARKEWLEEDYYAELGVDSSASDSEIKKAYRKLAAKFHPDANPDNKRAEERFKKISSAYDTLSDPEKKQQYDQVRRYASQGGFHPGGGGGQGFSFDFEGGDISDLIGSMFGGGAPGQGPGRAGGFSQMPRRGADHEARLAISFDESVNGLTTSVTVGSSTGSRNIKVRIPAGVADGHVLKLAGKGGPGANGGPDGDLLVKLSVGSHPVFGRKGNNLTVEVPISFAQATLGAKIAAPTFDGGTVSLRIPPGTESGKTFRVKGKGIKTKAALGNLLVTVRIEVPTDLAPEAIEALEQFDALANPFPRSDDVSAEPKLAK